MLSEKQYKEKCLKVGKCVELFIQIPEMTEDKISKLTKISQSSVDRYLHDYDIIKTIYGSRSQEVIDKINEKLKNNKVVGTIKGGINSQAVSPYLKDDIGHFQGSNKIK